MVEIVEAALKSKPIKSRGKYFGVPTFMQDSFLFIAGIYQEAKLRMTNYLSLYYSDKSEGRFLINLFDEVFGELPGDRSKPTPTKPYRRQLTYCCNQVLDVLREITQNNFHPPYTLLSTRERKLLYLKGFLFKGATVSYRSRRVKSTNLPRKLPMINIYAFPGKIDLVRKICEMLKSFSINSIEFSEGLRVENMKSLKKILSFKLLNPAALEKLDVLLKDFRSYWNNPRLVLARSADFPSALNAIGRERMDKVMNRCLYTGNVGLVERVEQAKKGIFKP